MLSWDSHDQMHVMGCSSHGQTYSHSFPPKKYEPFLIIVELVDNYNIAVSVFHFTSRGNELMAWPNSQQAFASNGRAMPHACYMHPCKVLGWGGLTLSSLWVTWPAWGHMTAYNVHALHACCPVAKVTKSESKCTCIIIRSQRIMSLQYWHISHYKFSLA